MGIPKWGFRMKVDKNAGGSKREFITMLKVAGILAVILSLPAGLIAAIEIRGSGFDGALALISLAMQLFFAGMMMLAASAALDLLGSLRDAMTDNSLETRRYGRTRSNKGSLLASKLAAEPAASS